MIRRFIKQTLCITLALACVQGCFAASSSNNNNNKNTSTRMQKHVDQILKANGCIVLIKDKTFNSDHVLYCIAYNQVFGDRGRAYDVEYYLQNGRSKVVVEKQDIEQSLLFCRELYKEISQSKIKNKIDVWGRKLYQEKFKYPLRPSKLTEGQTITLEPEAASPRYVSLGLRRTKTFANVAEEFSNH